MNWCYVQGRQLDQLEVIESHPVKMNTSMAMFLSLLDFQNFFLFMF